MSKTAEQAPHQRCRDGEYTCEEMLSVIRHQGTAD